MKKQIFIVAAIVVALSFSNQLLAQVAVAKSTGYDLKSNVKCRIASSDKGCDIVFENEVISPRDAASGLATGKRQHKPYHFVVSSADNSVSEITVTKDVATGQASGKRMSNTAGGSGKVSLSDLSFVVKQNGRSKKIAANDGEFILPVDFQNGTLAATLSWSWGTSNSDSSKRCSVDFLLEIEDGICKAINQSGVK